MIYTVFTDTPNLLAIISLASLTEESDEISDSSVIELAKHNRMLFEGFALNVRKDI